MFSIRLNLTAAQFRLKINNEADIFPYTLAMRFMYVCNRNHFTCRDHFYLIANMVRKLCYYFEIIGHNTELMKTAKFTKVTVM